MTRHKREPIIMSAVSVTLKSGITKVILNLCDRRCISYHSHSSYNPDKTSSETFAAGLRRRKHDQFTVDTTRFPFGIWFDSRCKDQAIFCHVPYTLLTDNPEIQRKLKEL